MGDLARSGAFFERAIGAGIRADELTAAVADLFPLTNSDSLARLRSNYKWQMQERGVPRKYYGITNAGRAEMHRQLEQWRGFVAVVSSLVNETQGAEP